MNATQTFRSNTARAVLPVVIRVVVVSVAMQAPSRIG